MKNRRLRRRSIPAAVAALLFLFGCGASDSDRVPLTGTVSGHEGRVERGRLTFIPSDGGSGPTVSTAIDAGSYRFSESDGPLPGRYRVIITDFSVRAPGPPATALDDKLADVTATSSASTSVEAVVPSKPPFVRDLSVE